MRRLSAVGEWQITINCSCGRTYTTHGYGQGYGGLDGCPHCHDKWQANVQVQSFLSLRDHDKEVNP